MKYAIFSDIHSNVHALEAAFKEAKDKVDSFLCLGDIVGYNAFPKECLKLVKKEFSHCVMGNHDEFISLEGMLNIGLSSDAKHGSNYSIKKLNKNEKEWLRSLERSHTIKDKDCNFIISHASYFGHISGYPYILNKYHAEEDMILFKKELSEVKILFIGHTHLPTFARGKKDEKTLEEFSIGAEKKRGDLGPSGKTFILNHEDYYIINPGAIGQARGGVPVSYIIFDTEKMSVEIKRFDYDKESAAKAIIEEGYCDHLAQRLLKDI
jgi:predicted phosphodiesterase